MKKTYKFLIVSLCLLSALSCAKQTVVNPYDRESEISVDEAELLFDEDGGEGTILVNCAKDYTVECNSSWASCEKDGLTVYVKAAKNKTIVGRSATIVLKCGQDSVKVVAQQLAYEFKKNIPEEIAWDDTKGSFTYDYRAPYTVTVQKTASWFEAKIVGESLKISFDENTTGIARVGKVYLRGPKSTDPVDSIFLSQYDLKGHLVGEYQFDYDHKEWDFELQKVVRVHYTTTAEITYDEDTKKIHLVTEPGFPIPLTFDPVNMTVSIMCLQYCGVEKTGNSTYYIYTATVDSNKGTMICYAPIGMYAPVTTLEGKTYLKFVDNGVWKTLSESYAEFKSDEIYLYRFTATPPSYEYSAGSMAEYIDFYLTKL